MAIRRRLAVLAACLVAVAAIGASVALVSGGAGVSVRFGLASLAAGAAFAAVGALLIGLRPGNRIGSLLFVAGAALVAEFGLRGYGFRGLRADPGSLPLADVAVWAGLVLDPLFFPIPLALVLLLFPDGRLPSRRWRPVVAAAVAVLVGRVALLALRPGPLTDEVYGYEVAWDGALPSAAAAAVATVDGLLTTASVLLLMATAVALVLRYRRSDADGRQRLKPLALVGGLLVASVAVQQVPGLNGVGTWCFVAAVAAGLPLALLVGALRYRVWELDRVLVATIMYGVLAVLITGAYVAAVVALAPLAGDPRPALLPSVTATALVAALFAPVRDRVSRLARRLVYGVRADPYATLAALPHRLADAPAIDEVLPRTAEALTLGLGVPAARVRAFATSATEATDSVGTEVAWAPAPPSGPESDDLVTVPVRHLGQLVGDVAVLTSPDRPLTHTDRQLLTDLAAQAGPALRAVALAGELRQRLDQITAQSEQLRASRQRIAAAQVTERRRLERDIHDGAQQQLVALAVQLKTAQTLAATDPAGTATALAQCRTTLDRCIDELRELARGIYPPVLAARGLPAALRARARMAPGIVRVRATPAAETARYSAEVALAAYFACQEAIQNAAKHAPGADITVHLDNVAGDLEFTIADNGPGFDPAAVNDRGTGLVGMADRINAAGGTLTVTSQPGAGTTVNGHLPQTVATPRTQEQTRRHNPRI